GVFPENMVGLDEHLFDTLESEYGLLQYELSGNFDRLLVLNYPAILEINLPDAKGTKYLALTSVNNGRGSFGSIDNMEMPLNMIDPLWTKKAIIFWNDFETLPGRFEKGYEGKEAIWLQKNLRLLGFFQGREAPVYGPKTVRAVQQFQRENKIIDDGRFHTESKMMLYNLLDIYPTPSLIEK
ncbi:MAG: peptidoglycan-binding protein, partial [Nitrospinales bacterium]